MIHILIFLSITGLIVKIIGNILREKSFKTDFTIVTNNGFGKCEFKIDPSAMRKDEIISFLKSSKNEKLKKIAIKRLKILS